MKTKIEKWFYGLGAAVIGGGAGAVTASVTVAMIDPEKFNPASQTLHFFEVAVTCFLVNGFMSGMNYLKQSPLPPESGDTQIINKQQNQETK